MPGRNRNRDREGARVRERARDRQLADERRRQGSCIRCGTLPPVEGGSSCEPCLVRRRAADKARYHAAKAQGLLYGGKRAETRRKNARANSKRRYEARTAAGLCVKCGKHSPAAGRTRCEACLARRNAAERDQWNRCRAHSACGKCGAPSGGAARCDTCAAAQTYNPEAKNRAARRRYARRKSRSECTECGAYSAGASRCVSCARRSYLRSGEHRGLPAGPASFRVVVIDTGEDLGCWQTAAELRACLAFSRLSLDDVEVLSDMPVMNGITAWT